MRNGELKMAMVVYCNAIALHSQDCQQFFINETPPSEQLSDVIAVAPFCMARIFAWSCAPTFVAAVSVALFMHE